VTDLIAKDLVEEIVAIANGEKMCTELLGQYRVCPLAESINVDRFEMKLRTAPGKALRGSSFHSQLGSAPSSNAQCAVIRELLEKYQAQANKMPGPHKQSVLAEGMGFDQARPMFKRLKTD